MRTTTLLLTLIAAQTHAQARIGSVATQDASLSGALEVTGGRAVLVGSSSVTAKDRTTEINLDRGGEVKVCQTSGVKLSLGAAAPSATAPLLLALDRGALEIKTQATPGDAILTPDLRFALLTAGPIDLRLRVARNGDTCVEQRIPNAPTLVISDPFGESTYEIHGGQHVLFEHGSLRDVVDHETSPCGCPPPTMSLAEAALRPPGDTATPAEVAATQHPFPAAESTGLAADSPIPQAPPGAVHTQVAATLGYEGTQTTPTEPPPSLLPIKPTPRAEPPHGFRHSIGRFFRKLFGSDTTHP